MRRYIYRARDSKNGRVIKGAIQAENERAAGKLLVEQGYTPDVIKEESEGLGFFDRLKNKVSNKDRVVFTRQFATLIGAGLPLSTSLRTVADQTESRPMRIVVENILADAEAGRTLADAFAKYPEIFNKVYLSLIKAGEASGTLDMSLKRLATQQERDEAIMSKIRGAMTTPLITLAVILIVVVFMIIVVVPQVQSLYEDLGKPLPWATGVLMGMANFLLAFWWLVAMVVGFLVWFLIQFKRTEMGMKTLATMKLNLPMFKMMFWRLYNARFARTTQILLSTGVSMLDTLKISAESMNNVVMQEQVEIAMKRVEAGKPLSESLRDRSYILVLVPQLASIGEQSGKIDEMLGKAAQVYEDELDEQIRTLSSMIEPVMMVVMAVLVGGIVMAVLFPIYAIVTDIQMGMIPFWGLIF